MVSPEVTDKVKQHSYRDVCGGRLTNSALAAHRELLTVTGHIAGRATVSRASTCSSQGQRASVLPRPSGSEARKRVLRAPPETTQAVF